MALINKLTAIADGFRASRGTTEKLTLDDMVVLAGESSFEIGECVIISETEIEIPSMSTNVFVFSESLLEDNVNAIRMLFIGEDLPNGYQNTSIYGYSASSSTSMTYSNNRINKIGNVLTITGQVFNTNKKYYYITW